MFPKLAYLFFLDNDIIVTIFHSYGISLFVPRKIKIGSNNPELLNFKVFRCKVCTDGSLIFFNSVAAV